LRYDLFRNQGGVSTDYTKVESYNGKDRQHTLTILNDSIIQGITYKFRVMAVNAYGSSDFSEEVNVGVSSFP